MSRIFLQMPDGLGADHLLFYNVSSPRATFVATQGRTGKNGLRALRVVAPEATEMDERERAGGLVDTGPDCGQKANRRLV